MNNIVICVPTFKEIVHVKAFLSSLASTNFQFKELIIVNGNYGDETTQYIESQKYLLNFKITEVPGSKDEFWSGTVNRGLNKIIEDHQSSCDVILCNIDIIFNQMTLVNLLKTFNLFSKKAIVGALGISKDKVFCSGVKVQSWLFPIKNLHPYEGSTLSDVVNKAYENVDFLPCRCILIPGIVNLSRDPIAYKKLPHYHADYEFTNRLKRKGFDLIIDNTSHIFIDMDNTGISVFNDKFNPLTFFRNIFNVKHVSNLKYRINFVILTFPWYAKASAILTYILKTLFELVLGIFYSLIKRA